MELTVRPIDVWPDGWRTPKDRKPNPFQTKSYTATLELLDYELGRLDARSAHLQLDVVSGDVRRDGHLRANAKVGHHGVILTIDTGRHGVLTYLCDTFAGRWSNDPPGWQINVRAIALGLEALRKVERYGIAEHGQQYAGFAALPPGQPVALAGGMSLQAAAELLSEHSLDTVEHLLLAPEIVQRAYRWAAKANHPDAGGDPALFRRLTEARDLLEAAHG